MLRITTGSCEGTYLGGRSSSQIATGSTPFIFKTFYFQHRRRSISQFNFNSI